MSIPSGSMATLGQAKSRAETAQPHTTLGKQISMVKGASPDEEVDTTCGFLCCKSEGCQSCCNTPKGLGFAIWLYTLEYGIVAFGILNIIIVPLQRRYQFSATQVAWIPATQDVTGAIAAPVFGYIATFVHKGRLLALSAFIHAIGCLLFFLVHILSPEYQLGTAETDVCDPETELDCEFEVGRYDAFYAMFIIGQIFNGVGGAILWCTAVPYMDENIKLKNTPVYIGIMYAFAAIGAMIGYIVGGFLLFVYVDIGRVDLNELPISVDDPQWVGAWWVGHGVASVIALLCALHLSTFPKQLPAAARYRAERTTQAYAGKSDTTLHENSSRVKQIWESTKVLITNPTLMVLTAAGVLETGIMTGFIVFLPMIIVFAFQQTPASAAIIGGGATVPAAIIGQLLGGLIPKWLNLRVRGLILQTALMAAFVALMVPAAIIFCDVPNIAGLSVKFSNTSIALPVADMNMTDQCNVDCGCDTRTYSPICGTNNVEYFSPCHAACLGIDEDDDNLLLDCGCIPDAGFEHDATRGSCESECNLFGTFLAIFFFIVLFTFIGVTSGVAAALRCAPETERSYAQGFQSTIIRLLGNVPFPIIMGAMFDQSCVVWQYTCDQRGACWIYDSDGIGEGLLIIGLVAKGGAFILHMIALYLYKPPPEEVVETVVEGKTIDANKNGLGYMPFKEETNDECEKGGLKKAHANGVDNTAFTITSPVQPSNTDFTRL